MMRYRFTRWTLALALGGLVAPGVALAQQQHDPERDDGTPPTEPTQGDGQRERAGIRPGEEGPQRDDGGTRQVPPDPLRGGALESKDDLSDDAVEQAIDRALKLELGDVADEIEVEVQDGQAALVGVVDDVFARKRAVCVAEGIRGVMGVEDRLVVDLEGAPDNDELASWVHDAIKTDPVTEDCVISYAVSDGVVTLRGDVSSYAEKRVILENVMSLDGVREVRDEMRLSAKADASKQDLGQALQRRFQADSRFGGGAGLQAQVDRSEVTLSGTVPSARARQHAIETAFLLGATKVDADQLRVDPRWTAPSDPQALGQGARPGAPDRTLPAGHPRDARASDEAISDSLGESLRGDARLGAFELQTGVLDGVISLGGVVSNYAAKARAEELAWELVGARGVENNIVVTPTERVDDDLIEERLDQAFSRHALLNDRDIDFDVEDGRVRLDGDVGSNFERETARRLASRVHGVIDVEDELDVAERKGTQLTDEDLEERIRGQMFWSPFVSAGDITVTVENGVATLTGTVDSWAEITAATQNALEGGARRVVNELRVREE